MNNRQPLTRRQFLKDKITARALTGFDLLLVFCVCSCRFSLQPGPARQPRPEKIRAVIVTGGHDFQHRPFFAMFDALPNIEYVEAIQNDHSEIFEDITNWDYDVIVLYNMTQEISPKRQKNFLALLDRRVGLLALHHCIGAFQGWPEYRRITGVTYHFEETNEQVPDYRPSTYHHDIDFTIHLVGPKHPITRGLSDFWAHDETYNNCTFESDNNVLLTTDHPASDRPLCWTRNYRGAKVCYIQPGHGPSIFQNPNYRRLIAQAIDWCADKSD
jgi:type 1 glutamine amidotransferase